MSDIKDKLKLLGLKLTPREKREPKPVTFRLGDHLEGRYIDTPSGSIFVRETLIPKDYAHGWLSPIRYPEKTNLLDRYARIEEPIEPHRVVYIDTETTGLAGGTGTYAFMVGVGRFIDDGFFLRQYVMADPCEEICLIEALDNEFQDARATVSFNGKSFDIPLLESRFTICGFPSPFDDMHHYDLLHPARRLWKNRSDTCQLSALEYFILGIVRSEEDIPGYMIPQLYFDFLKTRDTEFFEGVLYHNREDIVSLAAFHQLIAAILENPDAFDEKILDRFELGKFYENIDENDRARAQYEKVTEPVDGLKPRYSMLCKRMGDLAMAVSIWLQECDSEYALLELAKHYEHKENDYDQAIRFTMKLIELDKDNRRLEENSVRLLRLQKKLEVLKYSGNALY